MKSTPLVSILMTIYNAEPYLPEALNSIVNQSFENWELIAVENGSSDASPKILASYSDPRIRIYSFPRNIGRTAALRFAFDRAQGKYIAVQDADDGSHPNRLARQHDFLSNRQEIALVGTWAEQINEVGELTGQFTPPVDEKQLYAMLGWSNPFVHSSVMYRAEIARNVGGYSESYQYAQDCALILKIAASYRVAMLGEYLCRWRNAATAMTVSAENRRNVVTESLAVLELASRILNLPPNALERNQLRQAVLTLKLGVSVVAEGGVFPGLKLITKAITRNPACLFRNGLVHRLVRESRP